MKLYSERLIIRDFKESDKTFYFTLERQEKVIQFESDCRPNESELEARFNEIMALQATEVRDKYSFIVVDKASKEKLGRIVI